MLTAKKIQTTAKAIRNLEKVEKSWDNRILTFAKNNRTKWTAKKRTKLKGYFVKREAASRRIKSIKTRLVA